MPGSIDDAEGHFALYGDATASDQASVHDELGLRTRWEGNTCSASQPLQWTMVWDNSVRNPEGLAQMTAACIMLFICLTDVHLQGDVCCYTLDHLSLTHTWSRRDEGPWSRAYPRSMVQCSNCYTVYFPVPISHSPKSFFYVRVEHQYNI